jgi:hypothetical protein
MLNARYATRNFALHMVVDRTSSVNFYRVPFFTKCPGSLGGKIKMSRLKKKNIMGTPG